MQDFDWDFLLEDIRAREVVPVIGRDLVTVERDGVQVDFDQELARLLASELSVEVDEPRSVAAVSAKHLKGGGERTVLDKALRRLVRQLDESPIPDDHPLRKLARIEGLRLFVTTMPDRLLVRAIEEERAQEPVRLVYASDDQPGDLPQSWPNSVDTFVYHLLGAAGPVRFAATEEDTLEFMHGLQGERKPEHLFDALAKKQLLLVGCRFPGWLTRFFIRAARGKRLTEAGGRRPLVVGGTVIGSVATDVERRRGPDLRLARFLTDFGGTDVLDEYQAAAFVNDLSEKWHERYPDSGSVPLPEAETKGRVFISYASEDREKAIELAKAIEALPLDVWLDREQLEGGDRWEEKLRHNVRKCQMFVPIMSNHVLRGGWFRMEWDEAFKERVRMPTNRKFILPVRIDDVPDDAEELPDEIKKSNWQTRDQLLATLVKDFVASQQP